MSSISFLRNGYFHKLIAARFFPLDAHSFQPKHLTVYGVPWNLELHRTSVNRLDSDLRAMLCPLLIDRDFTMDIKAFAHKKTVWLNFDGQDQVSWRSTVQAWVPLPTQTYFLAVLGTRLDVYRVFFLAFCLTGPSASEARLGHKTASAETAWTGSIHCKATPGHGYRPGSATL